MRPCRPTIRSVHPRAGGERPYFSSATSQNLGSSPRGRGTHFTDRVSEPLRRFIPARAGNARWITSSASARTVHPRAGGERQSSGGARSGAAGSSPRGRGTPCASRSRTCHMRFIPARAGNASSACPNQTAEPVHPRAGGERFASSYSRTRVIGSSPRGRGTPPSMRHPAITQRFIPARAGNATASSGRCRRRTVHPRAGGERFAAAPRLHGGGGSSPRGRGTPQRRSHRRRPRRFIPARAGNAASDRPPVEQIPVHPRAGGERSRRRMASSRTSGSSPRGRGTRSHSYFCEAAFRFIPARAGNAQARRCG